MFWKGKKGVALVTVLLFMTIATIAATAVYKWLNSAERASASRLKQSEAYQASQAGLNAARAWLAYNGEETAGLVTQLMNGRENGVVVDLGSKLTAMTSGRNQSYTVVATEAVPEGGSIKLKLISTGSGRDNSKYSQVAILKVTGLYQINPPTSAKKSKFKYSYFGGSLSINGGGHKKTSLLVNGDYNASGEAASVEEDVVVTGNLNIVSGGAISVGGVTCVGGHIEMNNDGTDLKDVYVAGNSDTKTKSTIRGNVGGTSYFEGDVDLAGNYDVTFGGNASFNGSVNDALGGHNITFSEELCLTNTGKFNFNRNHPFNAVGDVWIPRGSSIDGSIGGTTAWLTSRQSSSLHLGEGFSENNGNVCKDGVSNLCFLSNSNDKHVGAAFSHTCQQVAKDYCMTLFDKKAEKTCSGSKFTIQDMISLGNFESKANAVTTASGGVTVSDIVTWGSTQWRDNDAIGKLNAIYAATDKKSSDLYGNGGFMVVKPNDVNAFENTGNSILNGNFIFIFEERPNTMKLPQTTEGKSVLIFLKKGAGAIELEKGDAGNYGYFIYTKGDIDNIKNNGTLKGSVYAEAASCAKLGSLPSTLNLEFDQTIIDALSDAGAICDYSAGASCAENRDGSSTSTSSTSGSESSTEEPEVNSEPWVPFAPQLKIDLATQYVNNEVVDQDKVESLEPALVVIPRVIYTNVDSMLNHNGKKAYSVMYLGGLAPGNGSAVCHVGSSESSGTTVSESSPFKVNGIHTCVYEEGSEKSKFWVYVVDEGATSLASFDVLYYMLDGERCQAENTKKVSINIPKQKGGKLKLTVYDQSNKSAIDFVTSLSGTGYSMSQKAVTDDAVIYELTVNDGVAQITPFNIIVNDCGSATGSIQFKLEDEDYSDEFTTGNPSNELVMFGSAKGIVKRGELSADPYILPAVLDTLSQIPDCDESAFGENGVSWGAYIDGDEGCNEGSGFDKSTGPWECDIEGKANPRANMNASGFDEKKCIVRQENFPVIVNGSVTMAYASLKKRHYTLTVKISGLKGSAHVLKGDPSDDGKGDDEDFDVSIYDSNNNYMGTCKTGNAGKCSFTVYYDETYYARATGRNFNHWSSSDNSLTDINNRRITIRPEGNMTIIAYFTNAGYCFVEDFKNLYSYCDREVSGAYLGGVKSNATTYKDKAAGTNGSNGGWFANLKNDFNHFAVEGSVYSVAESRFVTLDRDPYNPIRVAMRDFGREPASAENGYQAKYCIDQCVSNKFYRYTQENYNVQDQYGAPKTAGTNYSHYYGIYCDVEGETKSELDPYTYMDKYSVADKEDLNTGVWSYFDPGERELGRYNKDDRHYRGVKQDFCLPDTCSTSRCCEENVASHPPVLDAPRIKGGYYAQDDTLSPWLKVIMTQGVQQPKGGPMRPSKSTQWNEKPFINRDLGYATHAYNNKNKVQQMMLRKHQAGYNGTLRETIKITGSEGIESWGSKTSLIFRANSDLTSFFTLAIDPAGDKHNEYSNVTYDPEGDTLIFSNVVSSTTTNTAHLQLCHCTEGYCYSKHPYYELGIKGWSPGWETAGNPDSTAKYGEKYPREDNGYYRNEGGVDNLGHCTWEKVKTNIPFNQLVGKTIQVTVDLDGPYADIELAYESDDGANMVYSDYHVNLEDPEVFHYSRPDNPITAMRNDTASHRYVGFNVHSAVVKFYNVSWRSGGNCEEGTTTEPSIYCGYDNPYVAINTKDRPKAYVTDYCPDGGECECTPTFYLNGSKWDGTFRSVATYGKGALQVKMECKDLLGYEDANGIRHYKENWVGRAPCAAFSTYDRGSDENMCTDSYHIFVDNQYEQRRGYPYIYLYGSEISGFDSTYSYRGLNNGGVSEKGMYTNVYLNQGKHFNQADGANNTCAAFNATGGCDRWNGAVCTATNADGTCKTWVAPNTVLIHPYKSGELGTVNNPDLIKVAIDNSGKWTWGETTKYIQLRDSVTGSHRLNLNGATFSFDILQPNNATAIEYWFVDTDGGESRHIPLDSVNYIAGMEVDGHTPGPETNGKYGISGYCLKDANKYYRVDNCDEHLTLNYNANGSVNSINRKPNDKNDAGFYIDYFEKSGAASYHKIPYGGKPDASMEYKAYDCCQRGLIWWRDAKGGDTPVNRHISVKVDMSLDSVMFKPDRVSRIYYRLENKPSYKEENPTYVYKKISNENEAVIATNTTYQKGDWSGNSEDAGDNNLGTFFHIGNIQSSCPSAFNLSNCQLKGVNRNVASDPLIVYQGDRVTFSADLDNTSDCYFDGAGHSSSNSSDKVACTRSGKNSYSITFNSEMQNEPLTFTATSSVNGTTKSCVQYVTVKKKATVKDGFSCDETPTTYVKNGPLPKIEASLSEYDANLKYAIYAGGCGNSGTLIEGTEATLMGDISQQFEPTSGSGNYYLCYGHAKPYTQEICSKQVNVVENVNVSGCVLSPSTVGALGLFDVSASTDAPDGTDDCSVTINGSPYPCTVNNGVASSLDGIAAPNIASDYPVTINVLGTEESCGTLTVSAGITDASSCNTGNSTNIGTVANMNNAPSQHVYMTKNTGYYVNIPYKYDTVKLMLERLSGSNPVTFSIKKCDGSLGSITITSGQNDWKAFDVNIREGTCNVFIVPDGDVEMNFNAW